MPRSVIHVRQLIPTLSELEVSAPWRVCLPPWMDRYFDQWQLSSPVYSNPYMFWTFLSKTVCRSRYLRVLASHHLDSPSQIHILILFPLIPVFPALSFTTAAAPVQVRPLSSVPLASVVSTVSFCLQLDPFVTSCYYQPIQLVLYSRSPFPMFRLCQP